jgi:hypothetical protein
MCGWVMTVGEMLSPVVDAMRKELLASGYIQADETPIDVQTHDKRGKNHQAYLWQYGTPGAGAVFDFRMSRAREGPKQFLGAFAGILQTDDYIASADLGWCTPAAGAMREGTLWMRSNSTRRTPARFARSN